MQDINTEQAFNEKIRLVLTGLVIKEKDNPQESPSCEIFVQLKQPVQSLIEKIESFSLDNAANESSQGAVVTINELRILLLVNFMAKLMNKRLFAYYKNIYLFDLSNITVKFLELIFI